MKKWLVILYCSVLIDLGNKRQLNVQELIKHVENFSLQKLEMAEHTIKEEFDVKNLMAVGKFLTLMATLGSLVACGATPYQTSSVQGAVSGPYANVNSSVALAYNFIQDRHYSLNPQQKQKQTMAVYSALESEYGVLHQWYEANAMGGVKAVHGYPQGSGFCKVLYSTVVVDNKQRNFDETACKEAGHDGWRFIINR
tara:strand:- start:1497 stop:2087 length:591 start_codon:yes stop_codon:yes gene_type:complete